MAHRSISSVSAVFFIQHEVDKHLWLRIRIVTLCLFSHVRAEMCSFTSQQ